MNFLDLGDPANGTAPFTLPGRQVAGNIVRIINNSSSQLQFFFPGNTLQIRVPSRSIRRVQLTSPEQRQVTWQTISIDPTFIGTSDTVIEVYAPDECDHPFEQATAIGGGGAINALAGNFGKVYHWDTFAHPLDPGYGFLGYPILDTVCPARGLYLVNLSLVPLDNNLGADGDKIGITANVGNSFALNGLPDGYWQFTSGGVNDFHWESSGLATNPDGSTGIFPGNGGANPYFSMPYLIGQNKGEEILIGMSMFGHGSLPYPNAPIVQVFATITMLAAA